MPEVVRTLPVPIIQKLERFLPIDFSTQKPEERCKLIISDQVFRSKLLNVFNGDSVNAYKFIKAAFNNQKELFDKLQAANNSTWKLIATQIKPEDLKSPNASKKETPSAVNNNHSSQRSKKSLGDFWNQQQEQNNNNNNTLEPKKGTPSAEDNNQVSQSRKKVSR